MPPKPCRAWYFRPSSRQAWTRSGTAPRRSRVSAARHGCPNRADPASAREIDWGGCRCQAFALTGDAARTDPACALSPDHFLLTDAREDRVSRGTPGFLDLTPALAFPEPGSARAKPREAAPAKGLKRRGCAICPPVATVGVRKPPDFCRRESRSLGLAISCEFPAGGADEPNRADGRAARGAVPDHPPECCGH